MNRVIEQKGDASVGVAEPSGNSTPDHLPPQDADSSGPTSIWRRVRRDVILLGAGNTCIVVAQLGFRSILIVALVPSAYGRLALILSLYNTITIIGASGLPNGAARHLAVCTPAEDGAIIRSASRAAVWPTITTSIVVAIVSGVLLDSWLAALFAIAGLSSLVYSLLTTGILRGRGRLIPAASIMPAAALSEVGFLGVVWVSGAGVTTLSAFGLFCLGNVIGLLVGICCVVRTAPSIASRIASSIGKIPTPRQLLGFSLWLGLATMGVALMPLIMRLAATIDSYTVVAMIDVAIVLLAVPQRMGAVIVSAVVPHATRALGADKVSLTISRREHVAMIVPFMLAAAVVAFTPIVGWLFDALGRPQYAQSANYLALALLAGPARILYGLVEGVLVAHGEARFLAFNSLSITTAASGLIVASIVMGSTTLAFAIFVSACWAIYLCGLRRIDRLTYGSRP